jgi:hypothetical protein
MKQHSPTLRGYRVYEIGNQTFFQEGIERIFNSALFWCRCGCQADSPAPLLLFGPLFSVCPFAAQGPLCFLHVHCVPDVPGPGVVFL